MTPDNIVQRLRDRHENTWHSGALPSIFGNAADEIERLRADLNDQRDIEHELLAENARARALISWIDGACTDQRPHADIEAAITRWKDEQC